MNDILQTRQTLLKRIQIKDDNKSWEEFVGYYQKFIYMICRRMNIDHHDSEEIVQKVFIKLWNQIPEIEIDNFKRFRSWLCTVTGNTAKDFLRSKIRRYNRENKALNETLKKYTQPEIEEIAQEEWERFIVAEALLCVKTHFSEKVMKVFDALHNGVPVRKVAEQFDIPENTVAVYKRRVLAALCEEVRRLKNELQ